MFLADYHNHTEHSFDSKASMRSMCRAALARGLREIAFTDHYDCMYDHAAELPFLEEPFEQDILAVQAEFDGRLSILRGIEIGQYNFARARCEALIARYPFDFILSSMHNIGDDEDLYFIDYKQSEPYGVFERYLDDLIDMAKRADFDVAAHLSYPARYMFSQTGTRIDYARFEAQWRVLFAALIERGKGIELNTSGLRQPIGECLPTLYLAKLYRDCGGEILTIGSDAHRPDDVAFGFADAIEIAKEAGFTHLARFKLRKPTFEKID